jgi:hypothetical protein
MEATRRWRRIARTACRSTRTSALQRSHQGSAGPPHSPARHQSRCPQPPPLSRLARFSRAQTVMWPSERRGRGTSVKGQCECMRVVCHVHTRFHCTMPSQARRPSVGRGRTGAHLNNHTTTRRQRKLEHKGGIQSHRRDGQSRAIEQMATVHGGTNARCWLPL